MCLAAHCQDFPRDFRAFLTPVYLVAHDGFSLQHTDPQYANFARGFRFIGCPWLLSGVDESMGIRLELPFRRWLHRVCSSTFPDVPCLTRLLNPSSASDQISKSPTRSPLRSQSVSWPFGRCSPTIF